MFIYFLYRFLGVVAFPLILLYILKRGLADRRYWRGLGERFGGAPPSMEPTIPGSIWLHAVSVGEVVSAIELLRQLRLTFPFQRLYLSVTTVAGRQIAEEKLSEITDGIFYAPLDFCWIVRRVLRRLKPQAVVVMETEIWPNLFREAKRFGCALVVINGRISDKAYPTYFRWRWFFQRVLGWPDAILVQNEIARDRYAALGAPPERLRVNGNLKYDFQVSGLAAPTAVTALCRRLRPDAVWIAASTMPPSAPNDPDEDDVVIAAHLALAASVPGLLTVLVPRRPERFAEAARKLEAAGVPYVRRSRLEEDSDPRLPAVLLLDTMGELSSLFGMADVVFMGGTFPQRGGHNILEPAFFARPIVIGPHMENFPDIAAEFRAAGALLEVQSAGELAGAVRLLLEDAGRRQEIGSRAARLAEARKGATARAITVVRERYLDAVPRRVHSWIGTLLLWPLSQLWRTGAALDRWRKLRQRGELAAPVISIGGVTMGGTGKTPLVVHLVEALQGKGLSVAVLTRGYRRGSPEPSTILEAGARCPVARTGDEAQIILRTGRASLGIGADRLATGRLLESRLRPSVMLLDDGFQHTRLRRKLDIVLLDALDPFGGDALFPMGRLREPLTALQRASAFVITRANLPTPWVGLERRLRAEQPAAPIFYSRVEASQWVSLDGSEQYAPQALPEGKVAAFCGLGNPGSFYATLAQLGIKPVFRWSFGDHSSYRPVELRRLATHANSAGARFLLTTQKDAINLPPNASAYLDSLKLLWLETHLSIDRAEEFLEWILRHLSS